MQIHTSATAEEQSNKFLLKLDDLKELPMDHLYPSDHGIPAAPCNEAGAYSVATHLLINCHCVLWLHYPVNEAVLDGLWWGEVAVASNILAHLLLVTACAAMKCVILRDDGGAVQVQVVCEMDCRAAFAEHHPFKRQTAIDDAARFAAVATPLHIALLTVCLSKQFVHTSVLCSTLACPCLWLTLIQPLLMQQHHPGAVMLVWNSR